MGGMVSFAHGRAALSVATNKFQHFGALKQWREYAVPAPVSGGWQCQRWGLSTAAVTTIRKTGPLTRLRLRLKDEGHELTHGTRYGLWIHSFMD
ncbi:hypothetical protein Mapa_008881 [Marchantia paleacea]|nr:hypothetical protein Mapa_008881 [Marchantia paleacea]